jgi:predicted amidophosphoribosyltransferase
VRAFKFRGFDFLGAEFARAALAGLGASELGDPGLVVTVPLPWTRRVARGFNQAERFGRPLAEALGVPFAEVLSRPAFAGAQSRLARAERLRRGPSGFRVGRARRVAGRRILLVDDVFTTGATARAAATALDAAGAAEITVLVVAWTPLETPLRLP